MTARRGRLIVLEGIDGGGKSTLVDGLVGRLARRRWPVARWHEPTDPDLGVRASKADRADPRHAAMLFTLDRTIARPELERLLSSADVVADRSFYSTLAYQGSRLAPGDRMELEALQRSATVPPDLVILLDLPPEEAMRRIGSRGQKRSPLERLATLRRVARAYRAYARKERWTVLDARRPAGELAEHAARAVADRLGPPRRRHP
jgi:dTMP kinase